MLLTDRMQWTHSSYSHQCRTMLPLIRIFDILCDPMHSHDWMNYRWKWALLPSLWNHRVLNLWQIYLTEFAKILHWNEIEIEICLRNWLNQPSTSTQILLKKFKRTMWKPKALNRYRWVPQTWMRDKVFPANNGANHSAPYATSNVLESKPIPRVELEIMQTT